MLFFYHFGFFLKSLINLMSESFSFIPRRVARPGSTSARPTRTPTTGRSTLDPRQTDSTKGKGRESEPRQASSTSHEDYAALVHLALSEYALWLDSDLLRRATDHNAEGCKGPLSLSLA
jgi:hypothetical protein